MMKKIIVLASTILVILSLSSCDLIEKSEMLVALFEMEELDSYQMDMTIDLDGEEFITSTTYVVGEYQETEVLGIVQGMFVIDNTYYIVGESYALPKLEEFMDIDEEDYDDFSLLLDFDFTVDEEGYYVLESDTEVFEDVTTIKFKLDATRIKEMVLIGEMEMLDETFVMQVTIEYSNYNNVDINVPLHMTFEEVETLDNYIEMFDVNDIISFEDGFSIMGMPTVDCLNGTCFIESEPGIDYDLFAQEASIQEENIFLPYAEFASNNPETISIEFFEFMHFYYETYNKYN